MVKKIDAESVAREDMPSYKDRSLMSRVKKYIDDSHDPKKLPEMMRRKTAAETDAGKGEGILQKLRSPYQSGADTEYNKRNSAVQKKEDDEYRSTKSDMAAKALGIKGRKEEFVKPKPTTVITPDGNDFGNTTPDVEIKKTEIVKTAPAVSKPALKSGTSKPAAKTEGQQIREGLSKLAAWNNATGGFKSDDTSTVEDENARTKTEAVEASEYKKGGMTKRPPKPAKKVPPRKFASGGSTSRTSASKRGDGCATKGHTKGNMR